MLIALSDCKAGPDFKAGPKMLHADLIARTG